MFDIFQSVSRKGRVCTREIFEDALQSPALADTLARIASEEDRDRRSALKKQLPVITWQAHFPGGRRLNRDAVPSGFYMVDIDHVDDPDALYRDTVQPRMEELGIVAVHKTPSTHGLRIVARCRPGCETLTDNQHFMADALGVAIDAVCKDYARSSFLVTKEYFYFLKEDELFEEIKNGRATEPKEGGPNGESQCGDACDNARFISPKECDQREPYLAGALSVGPSDAHEGSSNPAEKSGADTAEGGLPLLQEGAGGEASTPSLSGEGRGEAPTVEASYLGIPYSKIIQTWWDIHYSGREPVKSNRDSLTFELACNLRHICGFDRQLMDRVIPCYDGFPQAEKMKCIDSALKEKITRMPARLQQVLNAIKAENADNTALVQALDEAEVQDEQFYIDRIPSEALPMGVRDSLEGVSRSMAMPVLIGIGPMIGALATDVRLDVHGVSKRLNLMAYIVGEAASNKSQLDDLYLTWMEKLIEQDRVNHAIEDEYLEAVRRKKNSKEQPKDPHVLIRCESLRTSIAQLINRLRNSQGKHLYSYTSEADQLSQNNGTSWANLSVLIRSAYDNSKFDTDYANGVSTGVVIDEVVWNMTLCCTPDALYRAHKNYTDGGITRLALARTPDNTFAPLMRMDGRSEQAKENIRRVADLLALMQGSLVLPALEQRCCDWLESIRLATLKNDDKVRARLRMRSAVTAMRYATCFMLCGYAEWLLQQLDYNDGDRPAWAEGCTTAEEFLTLHPTAPEEQLLQFQTEAYLTLFDMMAEYTLDMLELFFRERIEAAYQASNYMQNERSSRGANDSVFNRLAEEFSIADARAEKGANASNNATKQMLKNWKKQGLVLSLGSGRYKKA